MDDLGGPLLCSPSPTQRRGAFSHMAPSAEYTLALPPGDICPRVSLCLSRAPFRSQRVGPLPGKVDQSPP